MTPSEIVEVVRALRKMHATKISLPNVLDVEFAPAEKRVRALSIKPQHDQLDEVFADPVVRQPKLTEAQREQLLDDLLDEYVPGH